MIIYELISPKDPSTVLKDTITVLTELESTYSIIRVSFEVPLLLVCNGFYGKSQAPNTPANVVSRAQRHIPLFTVQDECGQEGDEDPESCAIE